MPFRQAWQYGCVKNHDPAFLDGLVQSVRSGDDAAFEQLILAIHGEIRCFLAARAPSIEAAEEALQAGLVVMYQSLSDYRVGGTFLAWVKGICLNLLLHDLRAQRRTVPITSCSQAATLLIDQGLDDEIAAADAERVTRLNDCLGKLKPRDRELLRQRYHDGFSLKELAQRWKRQASHLSMILHRLRKVLLVCMDEVGP